MAMTIACTAPAALAAQPEDSAGVARYPDKPIRLIVPFAPGGGTDFVSRLIGQKLTERLGQTVVIDNRAGASGSIGADMVAKAAPDGYTIGAISAEQAIVANVRKMPYDLVRDFAPITQTTTQFYILVVNPAVPATSVKELIAAIKAAGGRFNFGTSAWSVGHLAGELFKLRTGAEMTHIAFKGTGPATTALLGGEISLMFSTAPPAVPLIKAGRLRALGITAAKRSPLMPELPTVAEAGVEGFEATGWNGLLMTAKTPKAIVAKLHREIVDVLALPDVQERYARAGIEPVGGKSEAFGTLIAQEMAKWGKVVRDANLKMDE
jgi:tripartite-type tricarboxylate transporter receptor subunit TctC